MTQKVWVTSREQPRGVYAEKSDAIAARRFLDNVWQESVDGLLDADRCAKLEEQNRKLQALLRATRAQRNLTGNETLHDGVLRALADLDDDTP